MSKRKGRGEALSFGSSLGFSQRFLWAVSYIRLRAPPGQLLLPLLSLQYEDRTANLVLLGYKGPQTPRSSTGIVTCAPPGAGLKTPLWGCMHHTCAGAGLLPLTSRSAILSNWF